METTGVESALEKLPDNCHYIDRKVLTLNQGINFFTGHSGSGNCTVIYAMVDRTVREY